MISSKPRRTTRWCEPWRGSWAFTSRRSSNSCASPTRPTSPEGMNLVENETEKDDRYWAYHSHCCQTLPNKIWFDWIMLNHAKSESVQNEHKGVGWELCHSKRWFHWIGFTNQHKSTDWCFTVELMSLNIRGRRNEGEEILWMIHTMLSQIERSWNCTAAGLVEIWKEDHWTSMEHWFFFSQLGFPAFGFAAKAVLCFPGLWLPRVVLAVCGMRYRLAQLKVNDCRF